MSNLTGFYGSIKDKSYIEDSPVAAAEVNGYPWWYGYVVCIKEDDDSLVVAHDKKLWSMRIKKEGFEVLGKPEHHIGDHVTVKKSGKLAKVVNVTWHFKSKRFFYTLDYGDRQSSNWFFDEDVEAADEGRHTNE